RQTVIAVPPLVAGEFRREHELPFGRQSRREPGAKSLLDVGRDARATVEIPAQDGLRRDLVHILPARPAGARKGPLELVERDTDGVRYFQHGGPRAGASGLTPYRR